MYEYYDDYYDDYLEAYYASNEEIDDFTNRLHSINTGQKYVPIKSDVDKHIEKLQGINSAIQKENTPKSNTKRSNAKKIVPPKGKKVKYKIVRNASTKQQSAPALAASKPASTPAPQQTVKKSSDASDKVKAVVKQKKKNSSNNHIVKKAVVGGALAGSGYLLYDKFKTKRQMMELLKDPYFRSQHPELVAKYRKALVKKGIIAESMGYEIDDIYDVYDI